ncbi:lactonase family protein [Acinetobacter pragensis]|uniref:Lactonase n=1 Tax=Acinetobacter pragensis TaxID=1806892 RepID=A0A151Y6J9_9GAMM|nr:lactonase family protein [Acinetobacter pragensis]KYQ73620.1 hypothetical protein AZH43_00430 [Acinetobacter pragensis]
MKINTFKQLGLLSGIVLAMNCYADSLPSAENKQQEFYIGTWTASAPDGLGALKSDFPSQGIYKVRLNADGTLLPVNYVEADNPSWLVIDKKNQYLYATNEDNADADGSVSAFKIDQEGNLTFLNAVNSLGQQPTHAEISPDNHFLFVANYSARPAHAGVAVFAILDNGSLGPAVQNIPFLKGSKALPERQIDGHAHSITFDPEGKKVYLADLGSDLIQAYDYLPKAKHPLKRNETSDLHFPACSGPRHLRFSKNGDYAYASTEMGAQVVVFKRADGKYTKIQQENLTEQNSADFKGGAGLLLSPDQRFLYVGNRRKSNEIAAYSVDQETGRLTLVGRYSSGGIEPRAFDIDATGQYLIVANVFSNTVSQFKRNIETGALTPTRMALQIGLPTDIKFISK